MSQGRAPSLQVEWTPESVRAVDVAHGKRTQGDRLAAIRASANGHRDVLVGIGRNAVFLKTLRLPRASGEDLRRLIALRLEQLFPLPADQLAFDAIQTGDQTAEGCLTVVAAMRAEDLTRLRADLQQAGMQATRILPVALGAAPAAARAGHADALVVEETPAGLALDVVQGGIIRFSRVAPAGSDLQAEARRTLAAVGVDDLAVVSTRTAVDCLHEAPPFAFALEEERRRADRQRIATRTRLALLMLLASLLLVALIWADRGDVQTRVNRAQAVWSRELAKRRATRDAENRKAQRLASRQEALARAFETAQPLSDLVAVIGDSLPPDTWLVGLNLERGKPLQIRGTAKQAQAVANLVSTLGASPRLRDVRLVFANTARIEETPVVQFSIAATAVGNLPLPTPAKRAAKTTRTRAAGARR